MIDPNPTDEHPAIDPRLPLRQELYAMIRDGLGEAWDEIEWDDEDCAAFLGVLDGFIATREAAAYRRGVEDGAKWGAEQTRKGSRISENFRHGYSESCTIVVDETPTEITARAVKELCDA